ncbi:bacterio-opsin activator domain-containing protein [Halalkalirubrum salinum]|uniref:bacterio-opsin activator domain-containing protein n=1 Tax=Halalkalirubrum salinum TaxID=2563889 RepID=UPI0010FB42E7|nr:bacterio-opsin activator domain-containing protein [Halalkalirubrum salinum]
MSGSDLGVSEPAYEALVEHAPTHQAAIAVRLGGEAGLRSAEIPRVRPRGLDRSGRVTVLSVPGETGIDRTVPLSSSLVAALDRYADTAGVDKETPYVPVSVRRVQMLVTEAATAAEAAVGIDPDGITPSALRQRFARTLLRERGVDPRIVRAIGGWASLGSLDPYVEEPPQSEIIRAFTNPAQHSDKQATAGWLVAAVEAIIESTDRKTLYRRVVEAFVSVDRWEYAWIGRRDHNAQETAVLEIAPKPEQTNGLQTVDQSFEMSHEEVPDAGTDPFVSADQTTAAVACADGESTYSILCVRASDGHPIEPADKQALSIIGRGVGQTITAYRWRDLLHSDTALALDLAVEDRGAFLTAVSAELGCQLRLNSTIAVSNTALLCYVTVVGATAKAVATVADRFEAIDDLRVVNTVENGATVGFVARGDSIVHGITMQGAQVRTANAAEGRLDVVAAVPTGTDVRAILDGLRVDYPKTRLVRRRTIDRPPTPAENPRNELLEGLSDRQRATIEAAYRGGYFDWPRGSTAEEMADAMDISSPTFHNHLRKAQRALLDAVFETVSGEQMANRQL